MLRREAEELKKQMEQLAQQQQGQDSSRNRQSSQSASPGSPGNPDSPGNRAAVRSSQSAAAVDIASRCSGANDQRLQQSLEQLRQATDDMRSAQQAARSSSRVRTAAAQAEANARRAAERLKEAQDMMNGMRQQQASIAVERSSERGRPAGRRNSAISAIGCARRSAISCSIRGDGRPGSRVPADAPAGPAAGRRERQDGGRRRAARKGHAESRARYGGHAAGRFRRASAKGLSELQQNEAKLRMQYSARYIRQGQGGYMVAARSSHHGDAGQGGRGSEGRRRRRWSKAASSRAAIATPSGRWRRSNGCAARWSGLAGRDSAAERPARPNGQQGQQASRRTRPGQASSRVASKATAGRRTKGGGQSGGYSNPG